MKATDKHKLIYRINTLEGLTDDERSALLGLLREHKTYGLVWEDKPEDVEERLRNELPVLIEDKERALTDAGPDAPNHILIEGDNLEALATLAYTHAGKIDVIYIDPPYNTGNKDFCYNDLIVDTEDSFRHSKWLSFMAKRLRIAKRLLSSEGIIFISIDDNEYSNLKLLCDEIFGSSNFITTFHWEKTQHFGRQKINSYSNCEYVICYASQLYVENHMRELLIESVKTELADAPLYNASNNIKELIFPIGSVKFNIRDGVYTNTTSEDYKLIEPVIVRNGININPLILAFKSRWAQQTIDNEYSKGTTFWVKSDKFAIRTIYHNGKSSKVSPKCLIFTNSSNPLCTVSRFGTKVGVNENATAELSSIIPECSFSYPKPTSLISYLISLRLDNNITVLDFFAGSGTTLHAVMQLNAKDGGNRQCILCTNNENGICENVTYERNKRVIEGYTKPNGEEVAGLADNNLRYYRTDFVGRSRSTKNMRRLVQLSTDMLCIKENLYAEKKSFAGFPTYKNIYRYFEHGDKKMLVIYDERYVDEIVKMIGSVETDSKIKVYVFSPSEDPWEASFEPVSDKVELCALPQAIYNTYKRILPKRRQKPIEPTEEEDALAGGDDNEIGGLFSQEGGDE